MRPDLNGFNDRKPAPDMPATVGALRAAAMRLAETRKRPKLKTRDLVGLLLSHGARTWRCSLPEVSIKVSVTTPDGLCAVRFAYPARS